MDVDLVIKQAKKEIEELEFKTAVAREKERLLLRKKFWVKLFPWKVTLSRRDVPVQSMTPTNAAVKVNHQNRVFTVGDRVLVYDRYRFAVSLPGEILDFSNANDGVKVKLIRSNSPHFPVGCEVWVHVQQITH